MPLVSMPCRMNSPGARSRRDFSPLVKSLADELITALDSTQ